MQYSQNKMGSLLKQAMKRQDITNQELTYKLGLKSPSIVSMWINNERKISIDKLEELCKLLNDIRFKFQVASLITDFDFLGINQYQNNVTAQKMRVEKEEGERKALDINFLNEISKLKQETNLIKRYEKESLEEIQAELSLLIVEKEAF